MVDESEHWVDGNMCICIPFLKLSVSFALPYHSNIGNGCQYVVQMQNINHVTPTFRLEQHVHTEVEFQTREVGRTRMWHNVACLKVYYATFVQAPKQTETELLTQGIEVCKS